MPPPLARLPAAAVSSPATPRAAAPASQLAPRQSSQASTCSSRRSSGARTRRQLGGGSIGGGVTLAAMHPASAQLKDWNVDALAASADGSLLVAGLSNFIGRHWTGAVAVLAAVVMVCKG